MRCPVCGYQAHTRAEFGSEGYREILAAVGNGDIEHVCRVGGDPGHVYAHGGSP